MPTGGRALPRGDVPVAECYVCFHEDDDDAAAAAAGGRVEHRARGERSFEIKERALCSPVPGGSEPDENV